MESLADFLGTNRADSPGVPEDSVHNIPEHLDAKQFAVRFLNSPEFKQYLINAMTLGDIPAAIITRMMDYAWGKPAERVIHAGDADAPIVTEVRRVIVRPAEQEIFEHFDEALDKKQVMH